MVSHDVGWLQEMIDWMKGGVLGSIGGITGYLLDVSADDGRRFSWRAYAVFVLCAFVVGQVLSDWLPADMPGRGGVLMVAGTAAYPMLQVMRGRVAKIIEGLR